MARDVPDYEADLVAFVATLTDDRELIAHLVGQSLARVADEPSPDPAAAARVWAVRGLLSDGYVLGAPAAPDVDTAADVVPDPADGDLQARFKRSSRLQRAVVALYYGRHSDAAEIARMVGTSESSMETYLAGVRSRLGIDGTAAGTDGEQSVRRLLLDRYTVEMAQASPTAQAERDRATAELEHERELAEQARLATEQRLAETARTDELIAELRRRLDLAVAARDEIAATIAELTTERDLAAARETATARELDILRARLDEQAEATRRDDELIVDLRQRLTTAVAAGQEAEALNEQRQATIAELTSERDLATARETATARELDSLQARLNEQAEATRRDDELIVDLRQRLTSAVAAGQEAEALNEQRQATIAELTTERDLATARETATARQLDSLQARLDQQAEQARLSAEERREATRRDDELIVDLRQRLTTAVAAGQEAEALNEQRHAMIAELTSERDLAAARETATARELDSLQARLDQQAEQARLSAEERREATRRDDELIVDLRQRLTTAVAAGQEAEALNEQRQATIAELTTERDLATARETATARELDSLQARLDQQAEQARLSAEERREATRRDDELIVDLRQRLTTAVAAGQEAEALNEQRQATIAELTTERDLATARETATARELDSLQARLDQQAEQARLSAEERRDEIRRTDSLIAGLRQPIATAQPGHEDEDDEPVPLPEPTRFETAQPMVFTAVGPV